MKITLIQPRVGHDPSYIHEPLNLGYIAAYLKKHGYTDVNIHIGAFEADDKIISDAADSDIVGFTATSPMIKHAKDLAGKIKGANPESLIVLGGAHASVLPENVLQDINIDVVVRGEGELTMLELVQAIERKTSFENIRGLSYKQGGQIIHNPTRELIMDLDSLPFPARKLIGQDKFLEIGYKKYGDKGAWVFSSRGCPSCCTYCASNGVWTRRWRARSPANIVKEIRELVNEYGVDRINFADDTFTISKDRVSEFCNYLKKENLNVSWGCNIRANTIDKDLLKIMKDAGCTDVWIGVESGSPIVLQNIRKGITINQIKNAFMWSKEVGLKTRAYLMIGSPKESRETIQQTESLVDEIQPDVLEFSIFTPYPGCEDYKMAKEKGCVSDGMDWSMVSLLSSSLVGSQYLSKEEIREERNRLAKKYEKRLRI
jgi:radical SAM superfamily enzyme YgiQ (UPF0313 family)